MLSKILKGNNPAAQARLDALFNALGDYPSVAWYPSAGRDFRDVLELSPKRAAMYQIAELPDLFIHTDYARMYFSTNRPAFKDDNTEVCITGLYDIKLSADVKYRVDPAFATFPDLAPYGTKVQLLDLVITSNVLGTINKPLFYFAFENFNFLDQVVLRHNIPITHLVKVRDGCGFGGNRMSVSNAYPFLSVMQTKYLLIDPRVEFDFKVQKQLKAQHRLSPVAYDLLKLAKIPGWSGYKVTIYSTRFGQQELTDEDLGALEQQIQQEEYD